MSSSEIPKNNIPEKPGAEERYQQLIDQYTRPGSQSYNRMVAFLLENNRPFGSPAKIADVLYMEGVLPDIVRIASEIHAKSDTLNLYSIPLNRTDAQKYIAGLRRDILNYSPENHDDYNYRVVQEIVPGKREGNLSSTRRTFFFRPSMRSAANIRPNTEVTDIEPTTIIQDPSLASSKNFQSVERKMAVCYLSSQDVTEILLYENEYVIYIGLNAVERKPTIRVHVNPSKFKIPHSVVLYTGNDIPLNLITSTDVSLYPGYFIRTLLFIYNKFRDMGIDISPQLEV